MEGEEAKIIPNKTLYVRNLNEKIKVEGKLNTLIRCRNAHVPVSFICHLRRGNPSPDETNPVDARSSIHCIPLTVVGRHGS